MRRLQQILTGQPALAELLLRRQRESRVEEHVKRALPPMLAARVVVVDARSTELVLATSSGAAAALLRQRVPDVARVLAQEGWEFTGIRVRVQARPAPRSTPNATSKQIDAASIAELRRLAATLGGGALAAAVGKLARSAAKLPSDRVDDPLERVEDQDHKQ
jgi:hypothetical protein